MIFYIFIMKIAMYFVLTFKMYSLRYNRLKVQKIGLILILFVVEA